MTGVIEGALGEGGALHSILVHMYITNARMHSRGALYPYVRLFYLVSCTAFLHVVL
jgi:hypothetical protein